MMFPFYSNSSPANCNGRLNLTFISNDKGRHSWNMYPTHFFLHWICFFLAANTWILALAVVKIFKVNTFFCCAV